MKIGISGYGRMGKAVEKAAIARGHEIVFRMDRPADWTHQEKSIREAAVVIDFSFPETAYDNIMTCFDHRVAVISGTTGWLDRFGEVEARCREEKLSFLYASNFNIGVNVLFSMNRKLASIMAHIPGYDVGITEKHHIHKKDAPSGTAITLAEGIIDLYPGKNRWTLKTGKPEDLRIESIREGEVVGEHTVSYSSDFDLLELKHEAKDRGGFAIGALMAAEWLAGKTGCFSMNDVLGLD